MTLEEYAKSVINKFSQLNQHQLKLDPQFYQAIIDQRKTFEIRKNDRNFKVGDLLHLKVFDGQRYTGSTAIVQVTYISDYEQKEGYVVMSIKLLEYGNYEIAA